MPLSLPQRLALAAIQGYQRHLSPRKGFCCAWRHHTGGASCSALGARAIRRHGVWHGLALLRQRMARCGVAHRRLSPVPPRPPVAQRGDCDLPCDCDLPQGRGLCGNVCDVADCCSGCDWPQKKSKKRQQEERDAHIPRRRGFPSNSR
ncbi:MAG: hypothetical protein JWR60_3620 [Polaromonas sp.]|nr:hypothetical protein [Polaromonas sp.]